MTRCLASTVPGGPCVLLTSPVLPLGFPGVPRECRLRCAVCLLWGADEIAAALCLWDSGGPKPASLPLSGEGPVRSQLCLLSFGICSILCSVSGPGLGLEPFAGNFSLCFSFLAIPQFRLLSHISSLRLSSGHSGAVLSLSMQPMPPCPAPGSRWWPMRVWATSPLGVAVRLMFCGFCFFFSQLCCPLRFQNSPQTCS